jgi:ATP-dependent DNA helicase RecQ
MGIFEEHVNINEFVIAKKLKISQQELIKQLQYLAENEVADYAPKFKGTKITYITERLADTNFSIDPKFYKSRKEDAFEKLGSVLKLLDNKTCRNQYILNYFGDSKANKCNQCNVCLNINEDALNDNHYNKIKKLVDLKFNEVDSFLIEDFIIEHKAEPRQSILSTLRWMIEHDLIYIDKSGKTVNKGVN